MHTPTKVGVIGAGSWGTTIANLLAWNGHQVRLWTHEQEVIDDIALNRKNSVYLPNIDIPESVICSGDVDEINSCKIIVMGVPTQFVRSVFLNYPFELQDKIIVNISKGIERHSQMRISEILYDVTKTNPSHYVVLTGPSHAEEVARKVPTTVVAASENHDNSIRIQKLFTNPFFRVYTSDDVIGCELGGALKNIIAIAAGIVDGLNLGDNTIAALITRALAGMTRLGVTLGAKSMTFSGLSGIGDLYVTCASRHSRNRHVGLELGKGRKLDDILKDMRMVAEGVATTESALELGHKHDVEMPITEQVYKILFKNVEPLDAIKTLMTRESKREWWW